MIIEGRFLLEKFPGKGGWTYAVLQGVMASKKNPFGWKKVRGTIDGHEIRHYHLMSMGHLQLFLPVNAAIRKKIRKEAGQWVDVVLHPEEELFVVPRWIEECFKQEPQAWSFFVQLSESEQKHYVKWIEGAKKDVTKTRRIVTAMERLARGEKLYSPPKS